MQLKEIIREIKAYQGLTRKRGIAGISEYLKDVIDFGDTVIGPGDDAGVIQDGDSYLIFSADGIWKKAIERDPFLAGRASVIVNVNDIYAMGGRPIAMVNVISAREDKIEDLLRGIKAGCELYRVPMIGGHFHPDSDSDELSVAIIGRAYKLLRSDNAEAGQDIVAVYDLKGKKGTLSPYSWNSIDNKNPDDIYNDLSIMVELAEKGLCSTAKDISNPGILGTLAMLLYSSRKGAGISLEKIPSPGEVDLIDWLKIYPSYGFILCADSDKTEDCISLFESRGITAGVIGNIIEENKIYLEYKNEREMFFDFEKDILF